MTSVSAARPTTRMPAAERREQILDVAHAIVDTEGFHAATMNRIAAEVGVTRTVIYQQVGDLPTLFVSLIDREAARAGEQFAAAVAAEGAGADDFVAVFEAVLVAVDAAPATWRLFLLPPEGAPPALHERLARAEEAVRAYFVQGLLHADPDVPDPEYTARILHAVGRELLQLRLTDPQSATRERLRALVRRYTPPGGSGVS